jgi:hypothetical protein
VFREVGSCFVGFHEALRHPDRQGALQRFLAGLDTRSWGGQGDIPTATLAEAFSCYRGAAEAPGSDTVGRARSVAVGNLLLAVIEQSRVQPYVREAFGVLAGVVPGPDRWTTSGRLERFVARLVTELALEVTMGDVHIRPGKGLPKGLAVPEDLAELVVDDERFAAYDSRPASPPRPPESRCWTELADRLTFIVALMPLLQQSPRLLGTSPFGDERAEIEAGQVPARFRRGRA